MFQLLFPHFVLPSTSMEMEFFRFSQIWWCGGGEWGKINFCIDWSLPARIALSASELLDEKTMDGCQSDGLKGNIRISVAYIVTIFANLSQKWTRSHKNGGETLLNFRISQWKPEKDILHIEYDIRTWVSTNSPDPLNYEYVSIKLTIITTLNIIAISASSTSCLRLTLFPINNLPITTVHQWQWCTFV